ncbi:MAG: hypothetical protein [Sanya fiers-like virus 37]|nr:MAG: hypothetical protein [Sanya fiers-like virus 37]
MPQLANIVVKADNGTTDVQYTGIQGSSGPGPAIWRNQASGTALEHRPEFRVKVPDTIKGGKRAVMVSMSFPELATNSTTGITSVINKAWFDGTFSVPVAMAQLNVNEFASQLANLIASTMVKTIVKDGANAS